MPQVTLRVTLQLTLRLTLQRRIGSQHLVYPDSKLIQRTPSRPWYVQCTIPIELRYLFKNQKQMRLTTSTVDLREAEKKKHLITQSIYEEFDRVQQRVKDYDKDSTKALIEAVARIIGVKASGGEPSEDLFIANINLKKLTQEIEIPETSEDISRMEDAVKAVQKAQDIWVENSPAFAFANRYSYRQLCEVKRKIDITVENIFINTHGFNSPFNINLLEKTEKFGDALIKYHEDNFVSDYWDFEIETAFKQERLSEQDRIDYNLIRPTRMSPDFQHIGFKSFEEWYETEGKFHVKGAMANKWNLLERVGEVPEVRAAGLTVEETEPTDDLRMDELISPYIESRTWNREKTKNGAIRKIQTISRFLGNPRPKDITTSDVIKFAKKYIAEVSKEKKEPPSLATLESIKSNGSQFMRIMIRENHATTNPFVGADLRDLGANESVKSYRPFDKSELTKLFNVAMPSEDRLILSMLLTTGMRLDEAALLDWMQIKEEEGVKYISLLDSENANVIVKNQGSLRNVPLPDALILPERGVGRLFTYPIDSDGKANTAASKRLMKHVRMVTSLDTKTVHSLRGNLKDLLRDAGVTKELNDFITGHSSGDVAGKYGVGFSLEKRYEALNSVKHPWLN